VHRVASLIAFLAAPVAVLLIARRRTNRESAAARAGFWLAIGGLAFLAVLVGGIVTAAVTGGSWWQLIPLGLVERGITGFDVAAVVALGVWVIRGDRSAPSGLLCAPKRRRAQNDTHLGGRTVGPHVTARVGHIHATCDRGSTRNRPTWADARHLRPRQHPEPPDLGGCTPPATAAAPGTARLGHNSTRKRLERHCRRT
jgi:hypothetical protein